MDEPRRTQKPPSAHVSRRRPADARRHGHPTRGPLGFCGVNRVHGAQARGTMARRTTCARVLTASHRAAWSHSIVRCCSVKRMHTSQHHWNSPGHRRISPADALDGPRNHGQEGWAAAQAQCWAEEALELLKRCFEDEVPGTPCMTLYGSPRKKSMSTARVMSWNGLWTRQMWEACDRRAPQCVSLTCQSTYAIIDSSIEGVDLEE